MNRIRLIGLTCLLLGICYFGCEKTLGPITNNNTGGSEVIGTLVLKTGGPAKNAQVIANRVLLDSVGIDSVVFVKAVFADIGGNYKFDSLDTGKYILACKAVNNQDTFYASINFHLDSVASPKQPTFKDTVGIDTLYRPGSISGQVSVNYPVDLRHIYCNIPGTSFNANPDSLGAFKISNVPKGTYTVLFSSSATGFNVADTQVQRDTVQPDSNTNIGLIKLHLSDGQIIPQILGLTANYDSSTDQVSLSWDSVPLPNFDHFLIIRKDSNTVTMRKDSIKTISASFVDRISFSDTLSYFIAYSIECFDVSGFHSPLSQPVTIQATAPEGRTVDSLRAPDSAGVLDKITVVGAFTNITSPVKTITWTTSNGDSVHTINSKSGTDSIRISFSQAGRHAVYFKAIDNLGRVSGDSAFVTIVQDAPKITNLSPNQIINAGDSVHCAFAVSHQFGTFSLSVHLGKPYADVKRTFKNTGRDSTIVFDTTVSTLQAQTWDSVIVKVTDSHGNSVDTGFTVTILQLIHDKWISATKQMVNHHSQHASVLLNGLIYVIGGNKMQLAAGGNATPIATASVEVFDTQTSIWTLTDSLRTARADFSAISVNNKIYAIGGVGKRGYVRTIEQYDPQNGWAIFDSTHIGLKQFTRAGTGCCAIGNKIYIFGGRTFSEGLGSDSACQSILVYDLLNKTWSESPYHLNVARSDFQAVAFKGKIYLLGGLGGDLDIDPLKSVESFDTLTGKCALVHDLPQELNNFSAVSLDSGICIIGGINSNLNTVVNSVGIFNPSTGNVIVKQSLLLPACNSAATAINGRIYLTGGLNELDPPATIDSDKTLQIYYQ